MIGDAKGYLFRSYSNPVVVKKPIHPEHVRTMCDWTLSK